MKETSMKIESILHQGKPIRLGQTDQENGVRDTFCSTFILCLGVILRGEIYKDKGKKRASLICANDLKTGKSIGSIIKQISIKFEPLNIMQV